jgi:hypothetical protein
VGSIPTWLANNLSGLPITYPVAPADVGGNVLAKCEAAMMVRLLMLQDREITSGGTGAGR